MIGRRLILLCITLVLLVSGSCTKPEQPTGTVTLTFTTGDIVTRSTTPGDGNPADGGGIYFVGDTPDLVILIENNSTHAIVKRYLGTEPTDGTLSIDSEETKHKQLKVKFTSLAAGEYTVYAIANTNNGSVWLPSTDFTTITSSQLNELKFSALDGTARPSVIDRMPLSAKGSLTVHSTGNGEVSLELLRCVAKVTVKFKNVTGGRLFLQNVNFYISDMNPTQGYVIPRSDEDCTGTLRPLVMGPVFPDASGTEISVSDTELTGTYYVFPSLAEGGIYYCSANFNWKIQKAGESLPEEWTLYKNGYYDAPLDPTSPANGLRVFDDYFQDIPTLLRNQHLTIEIRIGEGSNVSFNFIVGDWVSKTESIEFN